MPAINGYEFTQRESQVIHLLVEGKSTKTIAHQLGISTRAVEYHLTHIYEKLEVSSRTEATVKLICQHPIFSTSRK